MIAIVTAMKVESMSIHQRILNEGRAFGSLDSGLRGTLRGKEVVAMQSGIGEDMAIRAVSFLLDQYPLRFIISTGVAGALSPNLKTGDIVIGEKILSKGEKILFSDRTLVDTCAKGCRGLGMRYLSGIILTACEFVTSASEKMRLHKEYGAIAVEMESAFIAGHAVEKGIPFLAVRAISDTADTSFNIDFQRLERGGKADSWKSFIYFSMRPILYLELRKHRKRLAVAASRLQPLIEEIIDQLD